MTSLSVRGWRFAFRFGLLALGATAFQSACSSSTDQGLRRCRDSFEAYIPNADQTCGKKVTVPVSYCERLTSSCKETKSTLTCVESPDLHGYLMVLDPCGTLESIPEGWSLADKLSVGSNAAPDCLVAKNFCDGSAGSAGTGGTAGTGGSGGAAGSAGTGGASGSSGSGGTGGGASAGGTGGTSGSGGTGGAQ